MEPENQRGTDFSNALQESVRTLRESHFARATRTFGMHRGEILLPKNRKTD
jgi:hypothetical protein